METVFLIIITGFILYKFWSILGTKKGHEKPKDWAVGQYADTQSGDQQNVIVLPFSKSQIPDNEHSQQQDELNKSILLLKKKITNFSAENFINGSIRAFHRIVSSFADGNIHSIKKLVSPDVYRIFESVIQKRIENNERVELDIENIDASIDHIDLSEQDVKITVKFQSEQMNATIERDGLCHDNPAKLVSTVVDMWTFQQDFSQTSSSSSSWVLIKTHS